MTFLITTFCTQNIKVVEKPLPSEQFSEITTNGAWCWFSDPRAVYFEGDYQQTYIGWVDNYGNIIVSSYNHTNTTIGRTVIHENLEVDDHNNPSILIDDDGYLYVFYNTHMIGEQPLYFTRSVNPEDISEWMPVRKLFLNDEKLRDLGRMSHTYTNPVMLSSENNRIYLFWRGVDGKPCYSYTNDMGETWSDGQILFMPDRLYGFRRPYTKVYSDGNSTIHFSVTDGHPRKEEHNSIYYFAYRNGAFWKANGEMIGTINELPLKPEMIDLVYDARDKNARSWNWDIASTTEGLPIIAYARFPNETTHIYSYARWTGKKWQNHDLDTAGKWFPHSVDGITEPEPHYSGGMSLDKENPSAIYLSMERDSLFEIEQWVTPDDGESWNIYPVTKGSKFDNVRPFAVRNAEKDNPLQLLWMENQLYHHFAYAGYMKHTLGYSFEKRYHTTIRSNLDAVKPDDYLLVWSDEFDGKGLPNPDKWAFEEGFKRNQEEQYYTANRVKNARLEDGQLILEAHLEKWPNEGFHADSTNWKYARRFADFTSVSLRTKDLWSWQYGKVEVRAKVPEGKGTWPAIWMIGTNIEEVGWPACGEIDIMEHVGYDPGVFHANIHTEAYNHVMGTNKGGQLRVDPSQFHVFSMIWTPNSITFYIDDFEYYRYNKEVSNAEVWPFEQPFFLILNLAIGGSMGGRNGIEKHVFPQSFSIDYVRVYQK